MTHWARTTLALLLTLLVSVAACEVLLRSFAPIRLTGIQESYRYDDLLGFRLRSG